MPEKKLICVVAIVKNEDRFLEEWITYHEIIGVDHFFLYDDQSDVSLKVTLANYSNIVTVIPWSYDYYEIKTHNKQNSAYMHAIEHFCVEFEWTTFIDCDEFIVLRECLTLRDFLICFPNAGCISLNWHMFGHNGNYDYPEGLVTSSLTRRQLTPRNQVKSICKTNQIEDILSAHFCQLKPDALHVDANNKPYKKTIYRGKSQRAHINHYHCRSFLSHRKRIYRGEAAFCSIQNLPETHHWRFDDLENLKKFVTDISVLTNEYEDRFMLRYEAAIKERISAYNSTI